jgi:hypothetical protein
VRKWFLGLAGTGVLVFIGMQWIPCPIQNPPVEISVEWDSARTRDLFRRACADCHSNETVWPWYGRIAPVSWFVRDHVIEGREDFNISVPGEIEIDEIVHQIRKGDMPLDSYLWMHPEARLTEQEKKDLIEGLKKTF